MDDLQDAERGKGMIVSSARMTADLPGSLLHFELTGRSVMQDLGSNGTIRAIDKSRDMCRRALIPRAHEDLGDDESCRLLVCVGRRPSTVALLPWLCTL